MTSEDKDLGDSEDKDLGDSKGRLGGAAGRVKGTASPSSPEFRIVRPISRDKSPRRNRNSWRRLNPDMGGIGK